MPYFISLLKNIRKRSVFILIVMSCIGCCLSYSQVTIRDSISISPTFQTGKTSKSLSAADCYTVFWGVDYDAVHYPAPQLSVTVNGATTNVLNCPYAYDGGYGSSISSASSEFTISVSVGSCQQTAELPTVTIIDVPPHPGELSAKEIWFHYSTVPCGGCGTTYLAGRAYSTYAESVPEPNIELSVTSSDDILPNSDNSLMIEPNNIPILRFTEIHQSGSLCYPTNPVITWNGPDSINLIDFYHSAKDSLLIPENASSYAHFKDGNPDHLVLSISAEITDQYGSSSSDIEVHVLLQEGCPTVVINNSNVANNETESFPSIRVMKKMKYGSIVDYPEGTLFDLDIMTGSNYGTLTTSEGDTSDHFENIPYALYFRPDTSYHGEQATVTIRGMISPLPSNEGISKSIKKKTLTEICAFTGDINILPLDHFEIEFGTEDIAYAESTPFTVMGKTLANTQYNLKEDKIIQIKITGEDSYATFITPEGDTIKQDGATLILPYGDVRNGRVLFAAVRKNPITTANVSVQINLLNKSGNKEMVVKEQTIRLRVLGDGEKRVSPRIIGHNVSESNRINLLVGVTRGGIPQEGHPFKVENINKPGSGGHDHTNIREINRDNLGEYIIVGESTLAPFDQQTFNGGLRGFTYVASIFGDIMLFTVTSYQSNLLFDTLSICENIQNLELLPEGTNYDKIGGTDHHHGPPNPVQDKNHYALESINTAISSIADSFAVLYPNRKLRINDMSLINGGAFDIYAHWDQDVIQENCRNNDRGHCGHARGLNADISFKITNANNGQITSTTLIQRNTILSLIGYYYASPIQHTDHYHLQ